MLELEYVRLNTITPGVEGISMEDNRKSLDYYFYVMAHLDKLPLKVSQKQIEEWTPYTLKMLGLYQEL